MKEEDMNHLRQQDKNLRDALQQEETALPLMSADLNARLMQRMESEQPKQHSTVWRWMAAACLLLLIGIGYTLLPQEQQQDEPLVAQKSVQPQTEAPKAEQEQEPQAEPQQMVAKAELQFSKKPVKKQRKVVMKRVELIPTSEAESTEMKTLPASVIAQVKAYDQQSDLLRTTGIDDADPVVVMTAQVEDIRQRGMRLHEEIRQQMKN